MKFAKRKKEIKDDEIFVQLSELVDNVLVSSMPVITCIKKYIDKRRYIHPSLITVHHYEKYTVSD
ncbi:MAG: hypothetical protein WBF33_16630 [Candidatus Nitrosopolaris sp.]